MQEDKDVGVSVIVATYNAPRELDLMFCGLARQTRLPDEVLVADDGSSTETRDLVATWACELPCDVKHVWQVDRGYRKARIVNEAVRRAGGEHLIFLDGDSIPHAKWVADHASAWDGESVLCGRRVKLGPGISGTLVRTRVCDGMLEAVFGPLFKGAVTGDVKRFLLGVRLWPQLARCFHPRPRKLMGVNFSLPRKTFAAVNGYDEDWTMYGHEDRDLELRLLRSGVPFYPLLNRAIVYHIYHPMRPISDETRDLLQSQEASVRTRCDRGFTSAEPFDPDQ